MDWFLLFLIGFLIVTVAILFFMVARKIPDIRRIEVPHFRVGKEKKIKHQLLEERLFRFWKERGKLLQLFLHESRTLFVRLFERLKKLEQHYLHALFERIPIEQREALSTQYVHEGEAAHAAGDTVNAEKKCIEAIRIFPKNLLAYQCLAKVYRETHEYALAKATLLHIVNKIRPNDADALFNLGRIYHKTKNLRSALLYLEKAVALEPTSPIYLEELFESAIVAKNRRVAEKTFEQLKQINPADPKLSEFEKKIVEV